MLRRIMGKQSRRSFVGMAVFLWVVFSPGPGTLLWGAEEKNNEAKQALDAEREQAVKESVLKAKKKMLLGGAEAKPGMGTLRSQCTASC